MEAAHPVSEEVVQEGTHGEGLRALLLEYGYGEARGKLRTRVRTIVTQTTGVRVHVHVYVRSGMGLTFVLSAHMFLG